MYARVCGWNSNNRDLIELPIKFSCFKLFMLIGVTELFEMREDNVTRENDLKIKKGLPKRCL